MKSQNKIKWGIIGLGNIANQFAQDLLLAKETEIYAVASRNLNKSKQFAKKFKVEVAYGSYEELINDDCVDIVYIATLHNSHADLSIKALNRGKHVLCEEPIALNQQEADQMIAASVKNNRFLMEAFWTRFNPSFLEVLQKVRQGEIGKLRYINADFAFYVPIPKGTNRMTDISVGGGSLLDMGVYPLFLTYMMLGIPKKILASANFFESGADSQSSMILHYDTAQAVLHSSFISPSNMIATISGEEGRINLNSVWHETQSYSLIKNNHKVDFSFPTLGKGFTYEIEECHKCILSGFIESKLWSHQNSLDLIKIVDEVRKQTGLKFPIEK